MMNVDLLLSQANYSSEKVIIIPMSNDTVRFFVQTKYLRPYLDLNLRFRERADIVTGEESQSSVPREALYSKGEEREKVGCCLRRSCLLSGLPKVTLSDASLSSRDLHQYCTISVRNCSNYSDLQTRIIKLSFCQCKLAIVLPTNY